jgi:hypothetical protein
MSRAEPYLELTISPWPPADDSIVDLLRREIDRLVNIGHVRVEPLDGRLRLSTYTAEVAAEMGGSRGLRRMAADLHLSVTTREPTHPLSYP